VHSGDAAMVLPPHTLSKKVIDTIRDYTHAMAKELKVIGLMNVQYAVKARRFMFSRSTRAPRAPCHSSARPSQTARPDGRKVMAGKTLKQLGFTGESAQILGGEGIRLSVQPLPWPGHPALARDAFDRRGHGTRRRPRHRLRQVADGRKLSPAPVRRVFISVSDADKPGVAELGRQFVELGFEIIATGGTASVLEKGGAQGAADSKLAEGRPMRSTSSRTRKSTWSSTRPPARFRGPTR